MKKALIICLLMCSNFANSAVTCTCSSGSMVVKISGDGASFSCSDGGRLRCKVD